MIDEDYYKKYYQANKEKLNAKVNLWKKSHPERTVDYGKKYRKIHKEKVALRAQEKRVQQKETINKWYKAYRESAPRPFLVKKLGNIRRCVKHKTNRKLIYDIDIDFIIKLWVKQNGKCAISGYDMATEFKNPYSVSIDRIDSSLGYTKENVQLVCQTINLGKNSFSNEEILLFWQNRPIID